MKNQEIFKKIKKQIKNNSIILYMKGSPTQPSCGFSEKAVQAISECGVKFTYINVLENPDIRTALPLYSNWPTFPQLWVDGELIGGCNIILEMFKNGELIHLFKKHL